MEAVKEQFEQVFEQHRKEVQRLVSRYTSNPDDAQDLVQEVFVRAYSAYDQFTPGTNTGAWLYRITINTCVNAAKAKQRYHKHVTQEPCELEVPAGLCDVVDELVQKQDHWQLRQAMRSLSADHLLVLTLRFSDSLTLPEISHILGIPVDTVKARLKTALAKLQSAYKFASLGVVNNEQQQAVGMVQSQALDGFPVDGDTGGRIYHNLGSLYLRKGLISAALQEWSRAQQVAPTFIDAYLDSARQYIELSQPSRAVDTLEAAVSRIQNADLHVRLADLYVTHMRDTDEGIKHSKRAIEMEPQNPEAHFTAGKVYCEQGIMQEIMSWSMIDRTVIDRAIAENWRQSEAYFEQTLRLQEDFPLAVRYLARVHLGEKKHEQAIREIDTVVEASDGDESLFRVAGFIHHMAASLEVAEKYYRQSLTSTPSASKYEELASVLNNMKRYQDAYDTLQQAAALATDKRQKARIYVNMAVADINLGRYDQAIEHTETAVYLDPKQVHARCNMAEAHLNRGDSPRMIINICMDGLRIDPGHTCLYRRLAEAYYRLDHLDDALGEATTAVKLEQYTVFPWLLRAKILMKLGRYDEARQDVQVALDLEPENDDARARMEEIEKAAAQNPS